MSSACEKLRTYSGASRIVALTLYLIFVWGVAYARKDYLWIDGDDPNLLQQSLLINAGFIPNVDFFSGYPGLSLYLQALVIKLVGGTPLSEHLYTALQATALGGLFFWIGRRVSPLLLLLILLLIYSQGVLLNPTPNPGYLFEIAFIVGLKKTWDFLDGAKTRSAAYAGAAFGIALLAKQYGIFGPICFLLSTIGLLDIAPRWKRLLLGLCLITVVAAILYSYFGSLVLNTPDGSLDAVMSPSASRLLLLANSLTFVIPAVLGFVAYLMMDQKASLRRLPLKGFFLSNSIAITSFLVISLGGLFFQYGSGLPDVLREIMILAPKRINSYLIEVSFSREAMLRATLGLLTLAVLMFVFLGQRRTQQTGIYLFGVFLLGVLLFSRTNLSATLFLSFAYAVVVFTFIHQLSNSIGARLVVLMVAMSPLFVILVPYPNYAYHIPLLLSTFLFAEKDSLPIKGVQYGLDKVSMAPYLVLVILIGAFVFKANGDVGSYTRYVFNGTSFVSGDSRWRAAIDEASKVQRGEGKCTTYGCRYLLLANPLFSDYGSIIEKPIVRR